MPTENVEENKPGHEKLMLGEQNSIAKNAGTIWASANPETRYIPHESETEVSHLNLPP